MEDFGLLIKPRVDRCFGRHCIDWCWSVLAGCVALWVIDAMLYG